MDPQKPQIDYPGVLIITVFLLLLTYAGYLAYQSIDWDVLKHLEAQPLIIPTPVPGSLPAPPALQSGASTPSASVSPTVIPKK